MEGGLHGDFQGKQEGSGLYGRMCIPFTTSIEVLHRTEPAEPSVDVGFLSRFS